MFSHVANNGPGFRFEESGFLELNYNAMPVIRQVPTYVFVFVPISEFCSIGLLIYS